MVLGIFSFTQIGVDGAVYQMLNHGVSTGALFMLLGMIYDRRHTYDINQYGGLATPMPVYATFFTFIMLSSVGLPLLNGFVGEFMVLSGAFQADRVWGILAATGVIWSACYLLWMYQRVFQGPVTNPANAHLRDLDARERISLWPLAFAALVMGVAPMLWLHSIDPSVSAALKQFNGATQASAHGDIASFQGIYDGVRTMIPTVDYIRILPELVLSVFGIIIMLVDPALPPKRKQETLGIIALVGVLAALAAACIQAQNYGDAFFNMVRVDAFSVFFHFVVLLIALVVVLTSFNYLEVQNINSGEYYGLILFGTVGMMLMSSAIELVLIFIALEISSISTYILAGYRRRAAESAESSLKYFLLGSFATAFFLYGVALVFGATGTTNVYAIAKVLQTPQPSVLVYLAVALMFVGLGFKVASAPFHVWTPDVYEGSPAPVVALMSTGPKAAAFAVLLRVLFATGAPGWFWMVWVSAALSMTIGNIGALVQQNIKRLLAYSSIAHAGYTAGGVCCGRQDWHFRRHVLRGVLCGDERGRIRDRGSSIRARREIRDARRLCRAGSALAVDRGHPHNLPAVADWDPNYRRLFRQVLRLLCRATGQSHMANDYRRHQ